MANSGVHISAARMNEIAALLQRAHAFGLSGKSEPPERIKGVLETQQCLEQTGQRPDLVGEAAGQLEPHALREKQTADLLQQYEALATTVRSHAAS